MINSEFESVEEAEYPSIDAARKSAVATATKVAAESVVEGSESAAVEVEIYDDDALVARNVVTVSVADISGAIRPPG